MAQYDELTGLLRELLTNRFSPKPRYVRGVLGDGLGNVVVPDRPDKSYARFSKNSTTYFEIFNRTVNPVNNWPILIGELPWQPGLTQVVDTDWSAFEQAGWGDTLGNTSPHAPTHEWPDGSPGSDAVDVHLRAIVPGRAFISDTAPTVIYVNSFEYGTTGTLWAGLPGVDLQPMMSATVTGTMRYAGVYVDESTNSLGIVTGGTTVYTSALEPPRVSFPETGVIPIARVRVYGGQTGLVEADIKDARRLFDTGGGDPNAIPQSLLNAKGDLITATAADTPTILTVGTDGYVLTADSGEATGIKWAAAGGWPYNDVHNVGGNARLATVEAALNDAAVGAGDVVELGQDSTEDAVALDKTVTVQGKSREFALTVDNSANGLNISANGARAERLNVVNTTTAATTYGVYCNATGIVLERVSALVAAGGMTRYGIAVPSSMSVTLRECTAQGTGGGGTNAGLVVDGEAWVYGGELAGDDYALLNSGTVHLYGPRLNGAIYNTGTISADSWWYDASGDVHLAASTNGLNTRFENLFGDDVPAATYKFTQRSFLVDSGADQLGFETSQANPYSLVGTNFTLSAPASNYNFRSNFSTHWLLFTCTDATTPLYLTWSGTAKNYYRGLVWFGSPPAASDQYLFELRLWDTTTPGAGSAYYGWRIDWLGSTYPQYPLRFQGVRGTGVTFPDGGRTNLGASAPLPVHPFFFVTRLLATNAFYVSLAEAESPYPFFELNNWTGSISQFQSARFHAPAFSGANGYGLCMFDQIQVA